MEETTTKKPAKRPTVRQRRAAKAVVLNALSPNPKSTGEVLKSVDYGTGLQHNSHRVLESEGFKTALEETGLKAALLRQGITPDRISEKINVLLNAKKFIQKFSHETGETELIGEQDDYQAIDKGITHATKIYGILDETPKSPTGNTYNFIFNSEAKKRVDIMDAEIKDMLTKPNVQTP